MTYYMNDIYEIRVLSQTLQVAIVISNGIRVMVFNATFNNISAIYRGGQF